MIAAIVLAAGEGRRFGGAKVVASLDGVALVRHVVQRLQAGGVRSILVTAAVHAPAIDAALAGLETQVVGVGEGADMSASLRAGVAALPPDCAGFFVALADQPMIDPSLIGALMATWESSNAAAVVPMYRDAVPGHPVLFDATMRRRLMGLTGDRGARDLLREMGDRVVHLPVDAVAPVDVDTVADLGRLGS